MLHWYFIFYIFSNDGDDSDYDDDDDDFGDDDVLHIGFVLYFSHLPSNAKLSSI